MKKIFPHLFVILSFLLLFALGTWQMERRIAKTQLIETFTSRSNAAPITLVQYQNINNDEFRELIATGHFEHEKEMLVLNKPFNGKQGQHVFTPFKTDSGDTFLVNRGWVPTDKEYTKPEGHIEISGIIRGRQKLGFVGEHVTLDNDFAKNIWFWIDLPKLYEKAGIPAKDFYIEMVKNDDPVGMRPSYPYALPKKFEPYNEHLKYAITWYSLSLVLLLVYYFRFWKK